MYGVFSFLSCLINILSVDLCDLTVASRYLAGSHLPLPAAGKAAQSPEMWGRLKIAIVSAHKSASFRALWLASALPAWLLCWGSSQIEMEKAQVMSCTQFIIVLLIRVAACPPSPPNTHIPDWVSGSLRPIKELFLEKKSHAQQCCMKGSICCCGNVCHQSEQFLTNLQEHAATPGW